MGETAVEFVLAAPYGGAYFVRGAAPGLGNWEPCIRLVWAGEDYRATVGLRLEDFPLEFKSARRD